jgi:phospholipid/cholesterol/gamma-HCH transport system substrate-binding protein
MSVRERRDFARSPVRAGRPRPAAGATKKCIVPVLIAMGMFLLGGCALSLQSLPKLAGTSGATYLVDAVFANVLNLPDDAQVRLGAEVVGEVSSISTTDFQADLTLSIEKSVRLLDGTTAQIRFDNPLGEEYVLLQAPVSSSAAAATASFLQPGAHISESDTSTAPTVEDTFGALSLVLNGGGLNQLQTIIHELNDTFTGNQPQIRSFLTTIDTGVRTVAGGRAVIDAALASIESLSSKLNAGRSTIATGIDTIGPAVGVLASENTQLSSLFTELSNLGEIGTRVAQETGQDSVADTKDLLPVVEQLVSVSQQIGPDLTDLARFEAETPKVAPGAYLQVNVIADVLLPAGGFEPTVAGTSPAASAGGASPTSARPSAAEKSGAQAVSALLEGGLL